MPPTRPLTANRDSASPSNPSPRRSAAATAPQQRRGSPQLQDEQTVRRAQQLRSELGIRVSAGSAAETGEALRRCPIPLVDFAQEQVGARLPEQLLANLEANKLERPTPVQMQTIPCVLQGRHVRGLLARGEVRRHLSWGCDHVARLPVSQVLVSAPTGTGKTAAYLIPAIAQVLLARGAERREEEVLALVLAPIRELAIQIESVAKMLMRGIANMKTALLVGGFPVPTQRYRLRNGVQLIVATPGRFLDIFTNYSSGDGILAAIRTCIVDEVDMMLDVGFRPQISQILALLTNLNGNGVQLLFFSATLSDDVEGMVQQILKNQTEQAYIRVNVGGNNIKGTGTAHVSLNPIAQQQVRWVEDKAKKNELFTFLKGKVEESTVCNYLGLLRGSKVGASMLAEAIVKCCGIGAAAIHADKTQQERLTLLEAFVNMENPVLVSTNILSRGIDLLHVQNVVVYDFPKNLSDYVHLIGRTGRGDSTGNALTLINLEDQEYFGELVPLLRSASVSLPREIYQTLHANGARLRSHTSNIAIDEAKRAFRVRNQLIEGIGAQVSDWKNWNEQLRKRRRVGPKN
ncbi:unnamed protein product [Phytophthora fragariaefolia]|uniref:RNA helicase n=1 Tax=Phytophthora fragariaefolia TaxID=1490495 RepID=A0A9W6WXZ1_9STRA|nr:unnamed protein product [Phytophthora fragariaefolia]